MSKDMGLRLNKYMSDAGLCSRRQADRLILAGRVFVNGVCAQMGMRVDTSDVVTVDGKQIYRQDKLVVLAYNKPRGVVCTADRREKDAVYRYLDYPEKLKYIGRLDKQSEGLLLFTNQGTFAEAVAKAGNRHEKEYIVRVNRPIDAVFLQKMQSGVTIEIDGRKYETRPCVVRKMDSHRFSIVLTQGFNRQIRRMCETCGYHVRQLIRIRVMCVHLGDLAVGSYRRLDEVELEELRKQLHCEREGV